MTSTFRERCPGRVVLCPQVQRGWRPLPRPRRGSPSALALPIGPGFALRAWWEFIRQVREWTRVEPWWVLAVEPHKYRGANDHHLHALLGGVGEVRREGMWRWWYERYGRCRVEPLMGEAAAYIGKYISKGGQVVFSPNLKAARGLEIGTLEVSRASREARAERSLDTVGAHTG